MPLRPPSTAIRAAVHTAALSTGSRISRAAAGAVLAVLGVGTADEFWVDVLIVLGAALGGVADWILCNSPRIRGLLDGPSVASETRVCECPELAQPAEAAQTEEG